MGSLPVSPQPPAECPHGFHDFVVFLPQLLLPDRKNGLTSMKPLHHQLDGLISHLFLCHFFTSDYLFMLQS